MFEYFPDFVNEIFQWFFFRTFHRLQLHCLRFNLTDRISTWLRLGHFSFSKFDVRFVEMNWFWCVGDREVEPVQASSETKINHRHRLWWFICAIQLSCAAFFIFSFSNPLVARLTLSIMKFGIYEHQNIVVSPVVGRSEKERRAEGNR